MAGGGEREGKKSKRSQEDLGNRSTCFPYPTYLACFVLCCAPCELKVLPASEWRAFEGSVVI